MSIYKHFVNHENPRSLNYKLRQVRLRLFLSQLANVNRPVSILDIGGTMLYWENIFFKLEGVRRDDFNITIGNIDPVWIEQNQDTDHHYRLMLLDARDMHQFADKEFDIVHSNSVIEHVGDTWQQLRMAKEVRRVGKQHFLQTPNYLFPVEPHFRAFFFHWLPRSLRLWLVRARKMGHMAQAGSREEAETILDSAQLLRYDDVRACFPESVIWREKFLGLTKSFVVMGHGN